MRNLTSSLVLIAATIFISPMASAVMFTAAGQSVAVGYNGIVDGDNIDGLSASSLYTLDSISLDGRTWTFSGQLTNNGSIDSRVSLAGFDAAVAIDVGGSSTSGDFSKISSGNMPQGLNLDYCMKSTNGKNCAGGGGNGAENDQTLEFMFIVQLFDGSDTLELSDFAVRYQSITDVEQGQSGVGTADFIFFNESDAPEVPLPASAWLFMSALGGLTAFRRKRKV